MSIQSFLAKPALRIPLLVGTVIATVATSAPSWVLHDETELRSQHVDAGVTADTTVELDASHAVRLSIAIEKAFAREGKLRIEVIDSRPECEPDSRTYTSDDGVWRVVPSTPGAPTAGSQLNVIDFSARCAAQGKAAIVTVRFANEGDTPLDFEWKAIANIGEIGSDETPDGAFVHVKVQE